MAIDAERSLRTFHQPHKLNASSGVLWQAVARETLFVVKEGEIFRSNVCKSYEGTTRDLMARNAMTVLSTGRTRLSEWSAYFV